MPLGIPHDKFNSIYSKIIVFMGIKSRNYTLTPPVKSLSTNTKFYTIGIGFFFFINLFSKSIPMKNNIKAIGLIIIHRIKYTDRLSKG